MTKTKIYFYKGNEEVLKKSETPATRSLSKLVICMSPTTDIKNYSKQ